MASLSQEPEVTASSFNFAYCSEVGKEVELPLEKDQEHSRKGRKRTRDPENLSKKFVKKPGLRKNSPMLSITEETSCCKKKCLQSFSQPHLNQLRDGFQKLHYEEQNTYLSGLLHRRQTKPTSGHPRKSNPSVTSSGKRVGRPPAEGSKFSFEYTLQNEQNINVRVCQKAFCIVHGFGPKRLQVLRQKLKSGDLEADRRGKHGNHESVKEEVKDKVKAHIMSYPSRHSHYSRKDNSNRVHLSPELSIARLYRDFLEKYDPDYIQLEEENRQLKMSHKPTQKLRKPLITEHLYHDILVTDFNIHFGYPRTDTCSTCDSLRIKIEAAPEVGRMELEEELRQHQQLAQDGYDTFRYDRQLSKRSWANKVTQTDPEDLSEAVYDQDLTPSTN